MNHEPDDPAVSAAIADVEPLDELTKARLVKTALAASPPRRTGHWIGIAAAIAAVLIVVGGTAVMLSSGDDSRDVAESVDRPETASAERAKAGSLGDLGAMDNPSDLATAIDSRSSALTAGGRAGSGAAYYDQTLSESPSCALTSAEPDAGPILASGSVVWKGEPAVVAVASLDGNPTAFVLSATACAELDRAAL